MSSAKINGINIYYEVAGEGPPIAFAHGAAGNHMSWWKQVPVLSQRFTCVIYDQRGFGQSHDVPGGPGRDAFVDDLTGLLDHLGIGETFIIGHSMGGYTALGFTLSQPERVKGTVLSCTTAGISEPTVTNAQKEYEELAGLANLDLVQRVVGRAFRESHPEETFLFAQSARLNPTM